MRQSTKCRSVRNDEIFNLYLRSVICLNWIPALREVDLEPSAKRGANKTLLSDTDGNIYCYLHNFSKF